MKVLHHLTTPDNIDSIKKFGLQPGEDNFVWMYDPHSEDRINTNQDSTYTLKLIKIDSSKLDKRKLQQRRGFYVYSDTIPPKAIISIF